MWQCSNNRLMLAALLLSASTLVLAEAEVDADTNHPHPTAASTGQNGASALANNPTRVLASRPLTDLNALIEQVVDRRVLCIGEQHDRYADHLNQTAIIEGLLARGRSLAIGLEMFQQPHQAALDAYVSGAIDEAELLRRTEYFDRWRFDYRLYRPILTLARAQRIPLIALNLDSELTRQVGDGGIASLSDADRARLPAIDRTDATYRARLEAIFKQHPPEQQRQFEHFLEVQLLWDEGMADRAARYLREHPQTTLVILAGSGHIEYGQGIPKRLARRLPLAMATILNGQGRTPEHEMADFFLYSEPVALPESGKLGVLLGQPAPEGGIIIEGFAEHSGAQAAGLTIGDRIVRVAEQPITRYADMRLVLLDAMPGQRVRVEAVRSRILGGNETLTVEVELH